MLPAPMNLNFCHNICFIGPRFGINNTKAWSSLSVLHCISGSGSWWCDGVGDSFFLSLWAPLGRGGMRTQMCSNCVTLSCRYGSGMFSAPC